MFLAGQKRSAVRDEWRSHLSGETGRGLARLAAVIARTDLDPWDAHVAAVADAAVCAILTLDSAKWREHTGNLDEPLHVIEIADPGKTPGDSPE